MFWKKKPISSAQKTGQWGELQALEYLTRRGYAVVATNYRKRFGEIDIIAQKAGVLVFVEVKSRSQLVFGSPLEAVDLRKQQRICRVAMEYLQTHQCGECNARFDVISVVSEPGMETAQIEHIENAFDSSL
ncbi:MAG: YraN family protein [Desulfobulbus sp.]|nr:YraN family protein [Desulfobulbus sp.]